ncbi:hypothetical protein [Qipengyuania gaetbuli]|uniref:hypothetical protein n=1 Tax=Qipengyuania gaetbuli TaxID=266952 RepID=UPI001CFDD8F3|nr:hypothetical protein [Qipengyuania gaetbuli]
MTKTAAFRLVKEVTIACAGGVAFVTLVALVLHWTGIQSFFWKLLQENPLGLVVTALIYSIGHAVAVRISNAGLKAE